MSKEDRKSIEQEDEIFGFLIQSQISSKNISRLRKLTLSQNDRISKRAAIVLEVAQVAPYKRKRLKVLATKRKDLLAKLNETDLIFAHHS